METTHHVLMSERFLRERGFSQREVDRCLIWFAMPDLIQGKIGYDKRSITHYESDKTRGGQLHEMEYELFEDVFTAGNIPGYEGMKLDDTARLGIYMHLIEDLAYDVWIAQYIRQERNENSAWGANRSTGSNEPITDIADLKSFETPSFTYRRRDTGAKIAPSDMTRIKRWSWGASYRHEMGKRGVPEKAICPQQAPDIVLDVWDRMSHSEHWIPKYRDTMTMFWAHSVAQDTLPDVIADMEDQMRESLTEGAFELWKQDFRLP